MTEDEARKVAEALHLAGIPGEASPLDPAEPGGTWWIRHDGEDVTLAALDALIAYLGGDRTEPAEPGWHNGRPVRGFVFPTSGRG